MIVQPIHVLVVEDDELDRMIIKRALKSSGINVEVTFAEDHESGKAATIVKNYDCIFLDYNLPGGTGLELLKTIREQGNTSPIIIVTSPGDEKVAVEAMKSGASDYIPKSLLSPEGLAQSLRYVIRFKEAEREKDRIEQALRESERRLHTVVSNSPIILFALDKKGIFTLFEGKGIEGLKADRTRIIGKSIHSFATMFPQVVEIYERNMQGEEVTTILEMAGRYYQVYYTPIKDKNNNITGVIGVSSDITDHKRAEEHLKKAKQLAEETSMIKEQFLANMSHEIRTPMNGIIGLTHILLNTELNEEQTGYMKSIKISSDNLLVIINDILDFSKIEAGRLNFEKIPFSINDISLNSFALFKAKADEKKLSLISEIDPNIPALLCGDPTRLSQILNNLIGNAIKFTEHGEVKVRILLRSKRKQDVTLDIEIKDTGIGIAKDSLDTIFDSFTQASSDTTRKFGGTGLGLTIVKSLIELQGGTIGVKSKTGEGTTFFFHLSFEIATQETIVLKVIETETRDSLSHLKILVAEDNAINQMIVKKILKDWGVNAECANNGRIAIEKLQVTHFDLILMDIQMPEMDGYTATQKIRNELKEPFRSIPIMAMTAHAVPTEKQKCFDLGMNEYISKPFNPQDLKKKIIALALQSKRVQPEQKLLQVENTDSKNETEEKKSFQKKELTIENSASISKVERNPTEGKINLCYLKEIADGNDSFIIEMIEMFLEKTPEALEKMTSSMLQQNWEEVRLIAHRIKPSFVYMGLSETQKVLAEIEMCNESINEREKIPGLIESVQIASQSAFKELEKALTEMK